MSQVEVDSITEDVEIDGYTFPPFDLRRLLSTVFELGQGENIGVFTDLPDPQDVVDFAFLKQEGLSPQEHAYYTLFKGLEELHDELGRSPRHAHRKAGRPPPPPSPPQ